MNPISDYHMHTPLCGHAVGEPRLYAEHAVNVGLQEIGFSDHAPMVNKEMPGITMKMSELAQYHTMIENVRNQFKEKLRIKISLEADFIPGHEDKTEKIIKGYDYDYIIGSVHFIKDWGFDNPAEKNRWNEENITQVYRDYFELLRQCARTGFFNIMGHVDLVKKFGHRPTQDVFDDVEKTAKTFKETGVAVEINTSGLRKPVGEIYPSLAHLRIYRKHGVPLTFGSDAHDPNDVGRDFDQGVILAQEAGYREYVLFKNRKIEKVIKL
jgi:histidinol-phosphatase (PHP family)